MFKERYKALQNKIAPGAALVNETVNRMSEPEPQQKQARRPLRRTALACALALALMAGSVPVLAANMPAANDLLYLVSPAAAQYFKPVQQSCTANGIELTVESAYIHGATAEIIVALRDLEGERVDETTDLFDSYYIRTPFDSSATCRLADYDPATKTATFYIWIQHTDDSKDISGGKLTFGARCFISGKRESDGEAIDFDLSSVGETEHTETARITFGSADGELPGEAQVLTPVNNALWSFGDSLSLTGAGYIDGKLHIQLRNTGPLRSDDHGAFYLLGTDGDILYADVCLGRYVNIGDKRADYADYVFNVSQSALADYTLSGYFCTASTRVDGSWEITFPLENVD